MEDLAPATHVQLEPAALRVGGVAFVTKPGEGGFQSRSQRDGLHTSQVRGLPETDVARVQRWCRDRVPERVRDEGRVEVDIAGRH